MTTTTTRTATPIIKEPRAPRGHKRRPRFRMADLFCGAGGTSTGAMQAAEDAGYDVEVLAVNHWKIATATFRTNHPRQPKPLLTGVESVNPLTYYKPGELDLLWASPECTHHSNARGGKPMNEQSRATAWCVLKWAADLQPNCIMIENVPEFLTWGGLCKDGRPVKALRGKTFMAWVAALESLGYRVGWKKICAADHGDPTTRTRLIVQAVRRPWKIEWPEPTHAPRKSDLDMFETSRLPYKSARDHVIDWTLKGPLLSERKKPLASKTMARILTGFFKQLDEKGLKYTVEPFIVPNFGERPGQQPRSHSVDEPLPAVTSHGAGSLVEPVLVEVDPMILPQNSSNAARSVDEPAPTLTTTSRGVGMAQPYMVTVANGGEDAYRTRSIEEPCPTVTAGGARVALAEPFAVAFQGDHAGRDDGSKRVLDLDNPLPTQTTENRFGLADPYTVELRGTRPDQIKATNGNVDDPLGTITAGGIHHAVVEPQPYIVGAGGPEYAGKPRGVDQPLNTVTTENHSHLVEPFVMSAGGPECPARPVSEPLGTVLTRDHRAMVEPMVVTIDQQGRAEVPRTVDSPVSTVTTKQRHAVAEPYMVQVNHGNGNDPKGDERRHKSVDEPLPTVCGARGEWSLIDVEPILMGQQSGAVPRPVSEPCPTVATAGAISLVDPYLVKFFGTAKTASVDKPLDTVTSKDRFGLVLPLITFADGRRILVDFRFRMLQPHELAAAQGFPAGYVFEGNKTEQVKLIGNAVPCGMARALVKCWLDQRHRGRKKAVLN